MLIAAILFMVVLGTVIFNFMSPWTFLELGSNWALIDFTVLVTFVICGVAFVILGLYMVWWVYKYRYVPGRLAEYEPENPKLEARLTIITTIGVVVMLAPGLVAWDQYVRVPPDATELEVNSEQWKWSYRLPGEDGIFGFAHNKYITFENPMGIKDGDPYAEDDIIITSQTVKIPIDRKVKVLLRSKDVLHDFWVPEIRAKMDSVPGMVTYFWFQPTLLGEFDVLCAELCGRGHHTMRGEMHVVSLDEYETWLGAQLTWAEMKAGAVPLSPQALQGRSIAESNGCFACHSLDGSRMVGPTWTNLWGSTVQMEDGTSLVVDEEYVRESIAEPDVKIREGYGPEMVAAELTDEEVAAVIDFLKSQVQEESSEQVESVE
ncbi:MAG: c-type cytochrome [Gammaproteobacteria bacterium]|nr:c-type cytochrome [Gammaproteobacteria bacterium]MYD80433.1 c-type cytochrome [Gammaproteobacteria bacterium]